MLQFLVVLKRLTIFFKKKNIGKHLKLLWFFWNITVIVQNKQKSSRLL